MVRLALLVATLLTLGRPASAEVTQSSFQKLSMALRQKLLSPDERKQISDHRGRLPALYETFLARWLTPEFLEQVARQYVFSGLFGSWDPHVRSLFLGRMAVYRDPSGVDVYHLPSGSNPRASDDPPCGPGDRVAVHPWWSIEHEVQVCAQSYRPTTSFDSVGYCAGQAEPSIPTTPRPGCACGPLLLACLPPTAAAPDLEARMDRDIQSEPFATATDILSKGRPFDELLTTSRTWQSGAVQFLYLRRELVAMLKSEPYSRALEEKLVARVRTIDLVRPAQWVEREGLYRGSGLFFTVILPSTFVSTYRVWTHQFFINFLCTDFNSVRVDSEALLKSIGHDNANLRALSSIGQSPMRRQPGCRGCHAPMDSAAAFLTGMGTTLFGQYLTGLPATGQLYVKGDTDLRGEGSGYEGLSRLAIGQPEFAECAVRRNFELLLGRGVATTDQDALAELGRRFNDDHHNWFQLIKNILRSDAFTTIAATKEPAR
jgi:hypothetical protein